MCKALNTLAQVKKSGHTRHNYIKIIAHFVKSVCKSTENYNEMLPHLLECLLLKGKEQMQARIWKKGVSCAAGENVN